MSKCFTPSAVERASKVFWDPKEKCIVSHADKLVDDLDNFDLDSEVEDDAPITIDLTALKTGQGGNTESVCSQSVDSVSTFAVVTKENAQGVKHGTATSTTEKTAKSNTTKKKHAPSSNESADSSVSMESRMSNMESSVNKLATLSDEIGLLKTLILSMKNKASTVGSASSAAGNGK